MTANEFRQMALSLPEAVEGAHMGHPDFRIGGKIFATLGPKEAWGMVSLSPEQQSAAVKAEPTMFQAFSGVWGKRGATKVILETAVMETVMSELVNAWQNTTRKRTSK